MFLMSAPCAFMDAESLLSWFAWLMADHDILAFTIIVARAAIILLGTSLCRALVHIIRNAVPVGVSRLLLCWAAVLLGTGLGRAIVFIIGNAVPVGVSDAFAKVIFMPFVAGPGGVIYAESLFCRRAGLVADLLLLSRALPVVANQPLSVLCARRTAAPVGVFFGHHGLGVPRQLDCVVR